MAGGAAAAARLVVRTQREQEIALVRPRVHADRGLAVVQPQRGPVRARLQAPADMRDRVGLGVPERRHVFAQQFRVDAAFDPRGKAVFHRQFDG
ncbi:hypothetical protein G6F68_021583 [Rhizopus microsporus]|nr:hypothetical protein G6F68_021583 [Rhizopus microsporus]